MALAASVQALKGGLLRHIRLPLQQAYAPSSSSGSAAALSLWRGFAGGHYLDKSEVTERVVNVAKHFEKIDAAKVCVVGCGVRKRRVCRARVGARSSISLPL